jgi:HlyD family secretion protein
MARVGVVLLVVGLAAAGVGVWLWRFFPYQEPTKELLLYGNIDIRQVQLAFNGTDRIAAVLVKEGDRVQGGQLLAKLDTRRLEAAVARAQAQVEAQRQVVARLEAGTRIEEIRKARADLELAEADVKNAQRTYERRSSLARLNAASQQEADDAEAAAEVAVARRNANKALLDLAIAGPRKEDIAEAKAMLKNYQAQLALAQTELADAVLYAPNNGVIQDRILEPGDMASPQKSVFTLALTDPVWVRAYVAEPDLGKITLGMAAEVETDSYPGKRYPAWLGFISPTAEFTPKSVEVRQLRTRLVYQVRVFVKNPQDELRLGMPVTVHVPLDQFRRHENTYEKE